MALTVEEIAAQAATLEIAERVRLAEFLLESAHAPVQEIEDAWKREVEDRLEAFEHGKTETISAEEVFAEAKRLTH